MNTKFANHVTATAFSLSLGKTAIAYLEYYVTGNYAVVESFNWPGWQQLERRGLINLHRDANGTSRRDRGEVVTAAGLLVFRLCQEAGLISRAAVPRKELIGEVDDE